MRTRLLVLVAVVAAVAAVAAVVVLRGGDEEPERRPVGETRTETLAFSPRLASGVVTVDTGAPAAGLLLQEIVPSLTAGGLAADDVRPLLGRHAAVTLLDPSARRGVVAFVPPRAEAVPELTRRLRAAGDHRGARLFARGRGGAPTVAVRGGAVVVAPGPGALRRALDVRADPRAHHTPRTFHARLGDLPRTAPVQAIFDARGAFTTREPRLLRTRWGRALRGGAAVLQSDRGGLRIPFRIDSAPGLRNADLPFAPGARVPAARGRAPLVAGVREPYRLIAFLRRTDPGTFGGLDRLEDGLPSFLRVDVDGLLRGLRDDATVTSATGTTDRVAIRTDPPNAGAWRTAIQGAATLSGVLRRLGVDGIDIDEQPGEVYRLRSDGRLVVRAGIYGPTLVLSNDPRANLPRAARAPVSPAPDGAAGGLTVRLIGPRLRTMLERTFGLPPESAPLLGGIRELMGWARVETTGLRGVLRLAVR